MLRRIRNLCVVCVCPNEWKELKQKAKAVKRHEHVQIRVDKQFLNLDQLAECKGTVECTTVKKQTNIAIKKL